MMQPDELIPGRLVYYQSSHGGPLFAAVTSGYPRLLGDSPGGSWVVRLVGLGDDYRRFACQTRDHVPAAALSALYPREHVPPARLRLDCPACGHPHVDAGEWATREHRTHLCAGCGVTWRPADHPTFGTLVGLAIQGHVFPDGAEFCALCGTGWRQFRRDQPGPCVCARGEPRP